MLAEAAAVAIDCNETIFLVLVYKYIVHRCYCKYIK